MEYRVYDSEKKCWIKDNIYLNPDGELFLIKQSLFGMVKVPLALDLERYVYHRAIDLWDKDVNLVYEGDYIRAQVDEYAGIQKGFHMHTCRMIYRPILLGFPPMRTW